MISSRDSEDGYSPGAGFHDPSLLRVSPEQRLIMRNIPFFVLPHHESTPRTAHIGPRVDTHNTSYVPAEPQQIGKPYTQKFDYSQVKSRIDTGRRSTSPASSESTAKSFGHSSRARSRLNAHRSSSPSPRSVSDHNFKSRVSAGHSSSKSEGISSSRITDYSHIKSRIDAGNRTSSAKSETLSLSADSGLKSRISSTLVATGGQAKVSSSPLPDYSHIKSRTDSGQRPHSKSSGSPRSSSMSQNKARPPEGATRSVKFESPSHRLSRAELPRSRVPLSDTFPIKARKSSPAGAVNRYQGSTTGLKFGSPERYHQKFGSSKRSINYNNVTRQLEPEFGRVSPSRSTPPQDKDTQDKISTRGQVNYSAIKSRIDCSDPNPSAHKLKHSLNELIVPLGKDINPRFSSSPGKATRIVKSSSFPIEKPVSDKTESKSASLVKSSTFESLFEVGSQNSGAPDLESEIEKATQASANQTESASITTDPLEDSPATMEVGLETVHHHHKFGWTEDYAVNPAGGRDEMFSEAYSTQLGKRYGATVDDSGPPPRIGESVSVATSNFHEDSCTDTGRYNRDEDDIHVVDFEVTNSETETTVVLKHLLATSSLSKESEATDSTSGSNSTNNHAWRTKGSSSLWTMPSIEESDSEESESYYESEEVVTMPLPPIVPYTLPIPTVNLQDEDGTILETILKGSEGLKSDNGDGTDATVDSGSDSLVANYSPQTVYDDSGPSTKL